MTIETVKKFAKKQGYDSVKKGKPWNGFEVYEPLFSGKDTAFVGLPLVILVKGEKIRMSTADEALRILDSED